MKKSKSPADAWHQQKQEDGRLLSLQGNLRRAIPILLRAISWPLITLSVTLSLGGAMSTTLALKLQTRVADHAGQSHDVLLPIVAGMAVASGCYLLVDAILNLTFWAINQRVSERLKQRLRDKEARVAPHVLKAAFPGGEHLRQSPMVLSLANLAGNVLTGSIANTILLGFFCLSIQSSFGWQGLGLSLIALIPLLLSSWFNRFLNRLMNAVFQARSRMNANTTAFFSHLEKLQSQRAHLDREQDEFTEQVQHYRKAHRRTLMVRVCLTTLPVFASTFLVQLLTFGWIMLVAGLQFQHAVQLSALAGFAATSLSTVVGNLTQVVEYRPELEFLGKVISLIEVPRGQKRPGRIVEIRFIKVNFGYTQPLLKKPITLTLRLGEALNLVGPKGTGKSTLLELLNPYSGAKLYSGLVVLMDEQGNEYQPHEIEPRILSRLVQQVSQGDDLLPHRVAAENLDSAFILTDEQRETIASAAKLEVDENNRCIRIYERSPFRVVQELPIRKQLMDALVKTGLWKRLRFKNRQFLSLRRRDGWRLRWARRRYLGAHAPRWWSPLIGSTIYEAVSHSSVLKMQQMLSAADTTRVRYNHITGDIEILDLIPTGKPDSHLLVGELNLTNEQWVRLPEIRRALELVGAWEDFEQHDMWLLASPEQLSGGQRKVLSIARTLMFLKDESRILILDEAGCHLDGAGSEGARNDQGPAQNHRGRPFPRSHLARQPCRDPEPGARGCWRWNQA